MNTEMQNIHKNKSISFLFFILFMTMSIYIKSQNSLPLPDGYQTSKDFDGTEQRLNGDFDDDGIIDLVIVGEDKNGTKIIAVYLGSKLLIDQSYFWFPWNYYSKLSFANKVLTIDSGDGEFLNIILKLKYYENLNNMKLIGYVKDEYMKAPNENGIGSTTVKVSSKNINLNTGEYQVDGGAKKKIAINTITLSDIEKYFEYLSQVGENN